MEWERTTMKRRIGTIIGLCFLTILAGFKLSVPVEAAVNKNDTMECPVYDTGDSEENRTMPQYTIAVPKDSKEADIPIQIPGKGVMSCILFDTAQDTETTSSEYKVMIGVYSDSDYTKLIEEKECSSFLGVYYETFNIKNQGTYYIKFTLSNQKADRDTHLCFMPALIMSADRELADDTWAYGASFDHKAVYYKVKADTDGYLMVNTDEAEAFSNSDVQITLCDSKKKELTKTYNLTVGQNEAVYGVNSGVYYMKVVASTVDKEREFTDYRLKYTLNQLKDNSGKSIITAKALTLGGKSVAGLHTIQDKSEDWFKITIKNKSDLNIVLDKVLMDGDFKVELYSPYYTKIILNSNTICTSNNKVSTYSTISKLSKGTYFIKITKANKTDSGYYSIKAY